MFQAWVTEHSSKYNFLDFPRHSQNHGKTFREWLNKCVDYVTANIELSTVFTIKYQKMFQDFIY